MSNGRYPAAITAALLAAVAFGQAGDAEISGFIKDPAGAVIPGAGANVTNQDSGVTRSTTADSDGRYRFIALPPGRYSLKVEAPGFKTESVTDLVFTIGARVDRNVSLTIGDVRESVTVQGGTPPIDTSRADVAGVVTQRQIDTLPTNTRQYLNLALLMPGTTQDASRTFYNNVQIGGGGRYYANGYSVDGVTNNLAAMGEPRQNFPTGAVQEFKVNTNQYSADQGLAMGGMVNIVTKSGTNQFHGELFEYFRQKTLNREDKFKKQAEALTGIGKAPFLRHQFGGDAGGPIVKNRTHFHVAFERTQTDDSYTIFTGSAHQFYSGFEGVFNRPSRDQLFNIRGDQQISPSQHLFGRYSQEWNSVSGNGCGGTTLLGCYDGEIPRRSVVFGHTWAISRAMVNEVRFQYAYLAYLFGPPGQPLWKDIGNYSAQRLAQLQIGLNFPSFKYGFTYSNGGFEKRYQVKDDLTILKGRHALKFGFNFSRVPLADDFVSNYLGTYNYSVDQVLNPKDPGTFARLTGATSFNATTPPIYIKVPTSEFGLYVQEEWRARPDLTLTFGLRYDREFGSFNEDLNPATLIPPGATAPKTIPFLGDPGKRGDTNNFGPRFGLAWNIRGKGTGVVRLGYGIYYNNIQTLQNSPEVRNLRQCVVQIFQPSYPDPYGGLSPLQYCSTAPQTVNVLAGDYANPYSQQFTSGYSRTIARGFSVHVDGVFTHTFRDYKIFDLNYPNSAGVRPIAGWARILYRAPVSQYKYKAMYVRAEKRFARRYQFLVSYTLASNRDDGPQAGVTNPANYNADWGPATIDRRHTLVASGSIDLPWRFTLGAIWQVRTSLPFSAGSNILDANGVTQYVPGTTRNQGNRGLDLNLVNAYRATLKLAPFDHSQIDSSRFHSFDIKLARPVFVRGERRIELIGQVFNLFGVTNLSAASGTATSGGNITNATSANFGKILGALNLQQAELAVRILF